MPTSPIVSSTGALATFIGIGAQKCASTWVHQVLAEHPQVFHSSPKELDFFSYFFGKGLDWYESHFGRRGSATAIGDNSPSYFVHPLAPSRAQRYNPQLKIIVALRDPVERAYSNHLHMVREGFISGSDKSFEHGLARNEMYVEQSRYAKHLGHWFDHFPREQVFIVLQEDLKANADTVARQLYRFLGVDATHQPGSAGHRANESRVSKNPGVESMLRSAGQVARSMGMGPVVAAVKNHSAVAGLRRRGQVDLRALVPPMHDDTRQRLVAQLAPDVDRLRQLLAGQDLPWPAFSQAADLPK